MPTARNRSTYSPTTRWNTHLRHSAHRSTFIFCWINFFFVYSYITTYIHRNRYERCGCECVYGYKVLQPSVTRRCLWQALNRVLSLLNCYFPYAEAKRGTPRKKVGSPHTTKVCYISTCLMLLWLHTMLSDVCVRKYVCYEAVSKLRNPLQHSVSNQSPNMKLLPPKFNQIINCYWDFFVHTEDCGTFLSTVFNLI